MILSNEEDSFKYKNTLSEQNVRWIDSWPFLFPLLKCLSNGQLAALAAAVLISAVKCFGFFLPFKDLWL